VRGWCRTNAIEEEAAQIKHRKNNIDPQTCKERKPLCVDEGLAQHQHRNNGSKRNHCFWQAAFFCSRGSRKSRRTKPRRSPMKSLQFNTA